MPLWGPHAPNLTSDPLKAALRSLILDLNDLQLLAEEAGLRWSSIDSSGPADIVSLRVAEAAEKAGPPTQARLVWALVARYPENPAVERLRFVAERRAGDGSGERPPVDPPHASLRLGGVLLGALGISSLTLIVCAQTEGSRDLVVTLLAPAMTVTALMTVFWVVWPGRPGARS